MKTLLYITLFFVSFTTIAQSKYEAGMQKALNLWDEGKSAEASLLFERIANAEPTQWLPNFYASQLLIFSSFESKDKATVTASLAKALELLNMAKTNSGDAPNPEIMVLEAQYYTAWVAFDGQQYGMKYAGKVAELYQKAAAIAPENPRVVMGKTEWDIGTAKFFGGDVSAYCNDIDKAIALFDTFKPESTIHPSGGLAHAKDVKNQYCKK